jgi:hypothetical protein
MGRFETSFLDDYSDDALLDEIRRVASQDTGSCLSIRSFDGLSGRVSASTIKRRFGGWQSALEKAGLGHLYSGRTVSEKMKTQIARRLSNDELVAEMKRVHAAVGRAVLTTVDFDHYSKTTSSAGVRNRFGTWKSALQAAGIPQSEMANRCWTEEECFENIATVWTQLGRQPTYQEMFSPPSTIKGKAYETRWGTWRKALRAFVTWASAENGTEPDETVEPETTPDPVNPAPRKSQQDRRAVGLRLRFRVFQRDRFRCVACGRSPATLLNIVLHADHISPVARNGKTVIENLQTLCQDCNLGKGQLPG